MKYDLRQQRKRLKISCSDIDRAFKVKIGTNSHYDRNGTYPQEVKDWLDQQEQLKEGGSIGIKEQVKQLTKRVEQLEKEK
jgi:serine phosphatase RsbU (regulator of sigma subunit)